MLPKNTCQHVIQMLMVVCLGLGAIEALAQNAGNSAGREGRKTPGQFKLSALGKVNPMRPDETKPNQPISNEVGQDSSRIVFADEQEVRSFPSFVPARTTSFSRRTAEEIAPPVDALIQSAPQDDRKPTQTASRRNLLEPVSAIYLNIGTLEQKTPDDRSATLFQQTGFQWSQMPGSELCYYWEAPNIRYKKLYFEDVAVERYGQVPCGCWQQTTRVTAHWAASLLSLPLKMRLDPYYDCDTPLGYCLPGECVSPIWQRHVYR